MNAETCTAGAAVDARNFKECISGDITRIGQQGPLNEELGG